ncbi:tRNA adenosine(34) deaminase TadA [Acanthopleuribacter pedis]|uniref:tRNA-specific adenosine deaminase n=1 Tax=Acanthopleuribacter pedis TaxID=442870 RepID=A0A8J7Q6W1_9BACT|nr:tRNA adenosine(34) deaminase TadA [Acanthopleuribacter pedis]MBO1319002.1 tRNA adenosine(34) deaminase TadA [Acanthopleuribacter pedis]
MDHQDYMRAAFRLAADAAAVDEVPVGALCVRDGVRLGEGFNQNISCRDPSAHAEILALRDACAYIDNYRLLDTTLYVTLEPCLMCFTACVHARVKRIVFGAYDPKQGFTHILGESQRASLNHQIEVVPGVLEAEAQEQIRAFFREKRARGKRKWMRKAGLEPPTES